MSKKTKVFIAIFMLIFFTGIYLLFPKTVKIYRPVQSNNPDDCIKSNEIQSTTSFGNKYLIKNGKLYLHIKTVKYIPIFSAILNRDFIKWTDSDIKKMIFNDSSLEKYFLSPDEENAGIPWLISSQSIQP